MAFQISFFPASVADGSLEHQLSALLLNRSVELALRDLFTHAYIPFNDMVHLHFPV